MHLRDRHVISGPRALLCAVLLACAAVLTYVPASFGVVPKSVSPQLDASDSSSPHTTLKVTTRPTAFRATIMPNGVASARVLRVRACGSVNEVVWLQSDSGVTSQPAVVPVHGVACNNNGRRGHLVTASLKFPKLGIFRVSVCSLACSTRAIEVHVTRGYFRAGNYWQTYAAGQTLPIDGVLASRVRGAYRIALLPDGGTSWNNHLSVSKPLVFSSKVTNNFHTSLTLDPSMQTGKYVVGVFDTSGRLRATQPLVVRCTCPIAPTTLVVWPSYTWMAYNPFDLNRDGDPDSWYTSRQGSETTTLRRYFEAPAKGGLSEQHEITEAGFSLWSAAHYLTADNVTDATFATMSSSDLARYRVVVYPSHTEYYTTAMADAARLLPTLGVSSVFLSANSFYHPITVNPDGTVTNHLTPRLDFTISGLGLLAFGDSLTGTTFPTFGNVSGEADYFDAARAPRAASIIESSTPVGVVGERDAGNHSPGDAVSIIEMNWSTTIHTLNFGHYNFDFKLSQSPYSTSDYNAASDVFLAEKLHEYGADLFPGVVSPPQPASRFRHLLPFTAPSETDESEERGD